MLSESSECFNQEGAAKLIDYRFNKGQLTFKYVGMTFNAHQTMDIRNSNVTGYAPSVY